ncbi:hypothetical protein BD769DRAFT_1477918 [Suillus cothurnatus]|nr:hypothetical protein BD769DRAFT_1477918 [Suillus cothurnatus]
MRISFILVVVAAFKLTASMPDADDDCPRDCDWNDCCPGQICNLVVIELFPVSSMSNFLLTPWLTGAVDRYLQSAAVWLMT